jgi:CRISP-associated protein Cas1
VEHLKTQFLCTENFQQAWAAVAENQGCAGVDGETIAHFAQQSDRYLAQLQQAVLEGRYRPMPLRQLFIPKRTGGWRELGVPPVRDRIVQQALLNVLHPLFEPQFEDCSFAYRIGRSHLLAVEKVAYWRRQGYEWVLDGDIVDYFGQIQHSRLLAEVRERINADWVVRLVEQWITVGVLTKAGILLPSRGVPQGAVISPILANVYLDDLDEALAVQHLKLVRFADDFVVLARTEVEIIQAKEQVAELLVGMGLELHPEKTRITHFKQGFRFLGHIFVGEVVVTRSRTEAEQIEAESMAEKGRFLRASQFPLPALVHIDLPAPPVLMQQALVAALKEKQEPIPPPLFVVLGYGVRSPTSVVISSDETTWEADMATLYLVQQGTTVKLAQERFVIQVPQGIKQEVNPEIPIREVERILVFGNVQLTTQVISTCLELQIPVIFLTQLGEYKGHLWSSESTDLLIETAQFERQKDEGFRLAIARSMVQGKLWNSKQLLLRLNRKKLLPEVAEAIGRLDEYRLAVEIAGNTGTVDQVRGYEGAGAALYFPALGRLVNSPGFSLTGRSFHPPQDPVNSLLSFGYTLLLNNVFSLLLAEGLNPYLGHLHGAERQKAYLAFDVMEEFRSPIVDSLVMKLVNQKVLKPTDFTYPNAKGGIYLEEPARRVFLKAFEARICEKVSHPDVQEPVSYRRAIQLQVKRYVKALLGNVAYEPFHRVI